MPKAIDVAKYIVYLASGVYEDITNMKVNKLLYYAQGHFLKRTGRALFNDRLEAWDHGPVCVEVYDLYKKFGDSPITDVDDSVPERLTEEEQDTILDVVREYGRYNASTLRRMTHIPNGPWADVYVAGRTHTLIPVELIKRFFDKKVEAINPVEIEYDEDDFIGYRDADGNIVLPKE